MPLHPDSRCCKESGAMGYTRHNCPQCPCKCCKSEGHIAEKCPKLPDRCHRCGKQGVDSRSCPDCPCLTCNSINYVAYQYPQNPAVRQATGPLGQGPPRAKSKKTPLWGVPQARSEGLPLLRVPQGQLKKRPSLKPKAMANSTPYIDARLSRPNFLLIVASHRYADRLKEKLIYNYPFLTPPPPPPKDCCFSFLGR